MTVRRATPADLDAIVEWEVTQPRSLITSWILDLEAGDPSDGRGLLAWRASATLDLGQIFVDDDGRHLGGFSEPLPGAVQDALYRRNALATPHRVLGGPLVSQHLSDQCIGRMLRANRAVEVLLPPYPVERVTVGLSMGDPLPEELWASWFAHVGDRPTVVLGGDVDDGYDEELRALGFRRVARTPAHRSGLPASACWLRATTAGE